jgi:soluble lytic murein transglycosylase
VAARYFWGAAYSGQSPQETAWLYPKAYPSIVGTAASQHRVSPALAWAIMRRESAFQPQVMSNADARGLMQVIPPTANAIAESRGLPAPAPGDLFNPGLNVDFGVYYLSQLSARFGHPALVAAAYNAGPAAVAKWLEARKDLPLDRFIEEIPYKETRGYVKQVLADLYLYGTLYGLPTPAFDFNLPAAKSGVNY